MFWCLWVNSCDTVDILSKAQEIIASDAGGLLLNEQYTGSVGESGFVLSTMDSDVKLTWLPLGTENLMG